MDATKLSTIWHTPFADVADKRHISTFATFDAVKHVNIAASFLGRCLGLGNDVFPLLQQI